MAGCSWYSHLTLSVSLWRHFLYYFVSLLFVIQGLSTVSTIWYTFNELSFKDEFIKCTFYTTENDIRKTQIIWVLRCPASSPVLAPVQSEKDEGEALGFPWPNMFLFQVLETFSIQILFLNDLKDVSLVSQILGILFFYQTSWELRKVNFEGKREGCYLLGCWKGRSSSIHATWWGD